MSDISLWRVVSNLTLEPLNVHHQEISDRPVFTLSLELQLSILIMFNFGSTELLLNGKLLCVIGLDVKESCQVSECVFWLSLNQIDSLLTVRNFLSFFWRDTNIDFRRSVVLHILYDLYAVSKLCVWVCSPLSHTILE